MKNQQVRIDTPIFVYVDHVSAVIITQLYLLIARASDEGRRPAKYENDNVCET